MLKKIFATLTILIATLSITAITLPQNSFADTRYGGGEACPNFLGLTSWDCNVPKIENESALKIGIWQIVANIATDITVIAAYLVLGYVIYGGYLYTYSYGDPGKVAAGKKTLTQAFIGLGIVISANVIMSSFRFALVGGGNFGNCINGGGVCAEPGTIVTNFINWTVSIAGVTSAIFLVYGGSLYIQSSGDPSKVQKAKNMITYSLIGLAVVALAATITAFVSNAIREANKNAYSNNITISKEVYEKNHH